MIDKETMADEERHKFEQMPKIKHLLEMERVYFDVEQNCYIEIGNSYYEASFVNGAWYSYKQLRGAM